MSASAIILALVQQALDDLDQPNHRLSSVVGKAIRVARLRGDFEGLYWLQVETTSFDKESWAKLHASIRPHLDPSERDFLTRRLVSDWMKDREIDQLDKDLKLRRSKAITLFGVGEIESRLDLVRSQIGTMVTPQGMHPLDTYRMEETYAAGRASLLFHARELEGVLDRIRARVHDYLSIAEQQLLLGQTNADIFERNRRYVEERLRPSRPMPSRNSTPPSAACRRAIPKRGATR